MQSYFNLNWCSLTWTPWINLKANSSERNNIEKKQGVYRVRAKNNPTLIYLGQTTNLKTRTSSLATNTYSVTMPWNDPHTAAPNLWAWRQDKKWDYEVSVSPTELSTQNREALECYLLWKYRLERGESTLCNHGRFHPDYIKPSNRGEGKPGYKISDNVARNPNGGASQSPLKEDFDFLSVDWMVLDWSQFSTTESSSIPNLAGLYRIKDPSNEALNYIGETKNLRNRITQHQTRFGGKFISYYILPEKMMHFQRLELENDLIGCYYAIKNNAPINQFRK
jgi:predicted GIY-YIG superfamily endonuclease